MSFPTGTQVHEFRFEIGAHCLKDAAELEGFIFNDGGGEPIAVLFLALEITELATFLAFFLYICSCGTESIDM